MVRDAEGFERNRAEKCVKAGDVEVGTARHTLAGVSGWATTLAMARTWLAGRWSLMGTALACAVAVGCSGGPGPVSDLGGGGQGGSGDLNACPPPHEYLSVEEFCSRHEDTCQLDLEAENCSEMLVSYSSTSCAMLMIDSGNGAFTRMYDAVTGKLINALESNGFDDPNPPCPVTTHVGVKRECADWAYCGTGGAGGTGGAE